MCGIVGYVGEKSAAEILVNGLRRLEYRGYDSAGIAIFDHGQIQVERAKGKLIELEKKLANRELKGTPGIGHTRWATHGKPSDENAHPHRSEHICVVHNGIIENHLELRKKLTDAGYKFQSETDTEIVPFLIETHLKNGLGFEEAVRKSIGELHGAFALAIMCSLEPDKLIAVKNLSPLIVGLGKGEGFIASDIPALLTHTRDVVALDDGDMAVVTRDGCKFTDFSGKPIERNVRHITWSHVAAEKEGFKHYMLKEIHEQPTALTDTLRGRVSEVEEAIVLDELGLDTAALDKVKRVTMVACGTSWHAALVGKFWFEQIAKLPTEVDLSSEYRYRSPIVDDGVLLIPISQSGETADTLAAMEEAKRMGARVLSICNVVDSSIARKSHHVLYTHAGPEIGVASTKAFTTQLLALAMLSLYFAQRRKTLSKAELKQYLHALISLPAAVKRCLGCDGPSADVASKFQQTRDFLYLGRGSSYPIALEGALKMKEISYVHAEGYPGGEIKHGPIALIDEDMPVVALASGGPVYGKMVSNIEEVVARGAHVITVVTEGDDRLKKISAATLQIPAVDDFIRPILDVIPLQLLAYHFADRRGTDVDQPRNLAKSVTVE